MTFVISPDFNLLLWLILIMWALNGICYIGLGALGAKKDDRYGAGSVVYGTIIVILVLWVLLG